jgi:hypothetical protein
MTMIRIWMPNEIKAVIFRFESPIIFLIPIKKPSLRMKDWVLFHFNLHRPPSKTDCEANSGRFSGLRIVLILAPSHPEFVEG